ncbi:hypothetical protein [Janthinobacterium sp. RA13]|uniref:hypothetical protein n=1 Tax=Janthinobacterium sp. RA13 TaxID=1502762 RepID=UPI001269952B|nr:hypothetical protein [Janthinobacterium sp. RA13]
MHADLAIYDKKLLQYLFLRNKHQSFINETQTAARHGQAECATAGLSPVQASMGWQSAMKEGILAGKKPSAPMAGRNYHCNAGKPEMHGPDDAAGPG